jgi:hypothetical protein
MEALYKYILKVRIEATYQDKASEVFQIMQASRELLGKIEARKPPPLGPESLGITRYTRACVGMSYRERSPYQFKEIMVNGEVGGYVSADGR